MMTESSSGVIPSGSGFSSVGGGPSRSSSRSVILILLTRRHLISLLRLTPLLVNCGSIDLKLFVIGVLLSCIEFLVRVVAKKQAHPPPIRRRWAPYIKERQIGGINQGMRLSVISCPLPV